jgi:hypothetical protein
VETALPASATGSNASERFFTTACVRGTVAKSISSTRELIHQLLQITAFRQRRHSCTTQHLLLTADFVEKVTDFGASV